MQFPLYIIWGVDIVGCITMIVLSTACLLITVDLQENDPENALNNYLVWLFSAILAFCISRSIGHLVKHLLLFSGAGQVWRSISPYSGGFNTMTFVIIFAVTLFFREMRNIMTRMTRDKNRIQKTSRQLLELNQDIEAIVSDRTHTELALRIAHEIRNPVMIIGGLLRRMAKKCTEKSDCEHLNLVLDQTRKLESLVNRVEDLQPEMEKRFLPIELNLLVKDIIEIVDHETKLKEITLYFDRFSLPLSFQGDQHLVKVALLHVLRNGIEACGPGNAIEIGTSLGEKGIEVRIEDNGPGIPTEIVKHIFKPFYSTKKGSTGLGLPYVRQIIEEHRGTIEIESAEGKGTLVRIIFPTLLGELQKNKMGV